MIAVSRNISSTDTRTTVVSAPRVLIAAGGTGGHVYPGIAIADALKNVNPDTDIRFVGTRNRIEWKAVPKAGYEIDSIWISGIQRRLTPQNLLFPFKLVTSIVQSLMILRRFRPDFVICCGGFAAGPVGWAAAKLGIPLLLQEQNSYPGLTNRLLAKHATVIYTAFEEAAGYLPKEKVVLAGNPVRSGLRDVSRNEALEEFGFSPDRPVLLILGGSGGAKTINDAVERHLRALHNLSALQIIWQCGSRYYPDLSEKLASKELENLRLTEFIDNMPAAYAAADLVVSRAGAITCSELIQARKPAILVPSPNVTDDHQAKNAASMVSQGIAVRLTDDQLGDELLNQVSSLIYNKEKLDSMRRAAEASARPDPALQIAREIENRSRKYNE